MCVNFSVLHSFNKIIDMTFGVKTFLCAVSFFLLTIYVNITLEPVMNIGNYCLVVEFFSLKGLRTKADDHCTIRTLQFENSF